MLTGLNDKMALNTKEAIMGIVGPTIALQGTAMTSELDKVKTELQEYKMQELNSLSAVNVRGALGHSLLKP